MPHLNSQFCSEDSEQLQSWLRCHLSFTDNQTLQPKLTNCSTGSIMDVTKYARTSSPQGQLLWTGQLVTLQLHPVAAIRGIVSCGEEESEYSD